MGRRVCLISRAAVQFWWLPPGVAVDHWSHTAWKMCGTAAGMPHWFSVPPRQQRGCLPRAEVDTRISHGFLTHIRVILMRFPNQPHVTKNQSLVINREVPVLSQLVSTSFSFLQVGAPLGPGDISCQGILIRATPTYPSVM